MPQHEATQNMNDAMELVQQVPMVLNMDMDVDKQEANCGLLLLQRMLHWQGRPKAHGVLRRVFGCIRCLYLYVNLFQTLGYSSSTTRTVSLNQTIHCGQSLPLHGSRWNLQSSTMLPDTIPSIRCRHVRQSRLREIALLRDSPEGAAF